MSEVNSTLISDHRPDLSRYETIYKTLHANPELSHFEKATAELISEHLTSLNVDLQLSNNIGGHGLIAIHRNGPGQTVLLRADMDALPVQEQTGLAYASTKTMPDDNGKMQHVMHACGHDMHVTCLLAATELLVHARSAWSGTLVVLFQPAEETGDGADRMVADGLYDPLRHACPIPDVVLGQHVAPLPPGMVVTKAGPIMNSSDGLKVTVFGRGGHGSMPHRCVDPVVIASHIIVRLQTIVSREISPEDIAVITVGSMHAGEKDNVICSEAVFCINVRAARAQVRSHLLDSIDKVIRAECVIGRCPQDPVIERLHCLPVTTNDVDTHAQVSLAFKHHFAAHHVVADQPAMGSEDFSNLASSIGKPYYFWLFGGTAAASRSSPASSSDAATVPINHSPFFAPEIRQTIQTGCDALTVAALSFLAQAAADGREHAPIS